MNFTDAENLNKGIPEFPVEEYTDLDGKVNFPLYNLTIDILSNVREYQGLMADPKINSIPYLPEYARTLRALTNEMYLTLFKPELIHRMKPEFVKKLIHEFSPNRLIAQSK
ncbi:hypothetical protein HY637_00160 [Candidatus Woesearchaeota archaeon]|nr:hypothetical protein [Candidatus Woesearchaeota archaeon]